MLGGTDVGAAVVGGRVVTAAVVGGRPLVFCALHRASTGEREIAIIDAVGHGMPAVLKSVIAINALRNARREGRSLAEAYLMTGAILEALEPLKRPTPPIDDPELAKVKGATFVEPELVCEVEYLEITKSTKKMRAPTFKGMRPDKTPDECVLELRRGPRG